MRHAQDTCSTRCHALALVIFLISTHCAYGGISAARSWAQVSSDGSRVFVMIPSTIDSYEQANPVTVILPDGRVGSVRDLFNKSGLYDAKSLQPLWTCDWFSQKWDIALSPDGSIVVQRNRFAIQSDWALAFHRDGNVFRKYQCSELLTAMSDEDFLPYETWDWHTRWYGQFEANGNRLVLSTASRSILLFKQFINLGLHERYEFDFATGEIVWRSLSLPFLIVAYSLSGLLIALTTLTAVVLKVRMMLRLRNCAKRGFPIQVPGAKHLA